MGSNNSRPRDQMDDQIPNSDDDDIANYAVTLAQIINSSHIQIISPSYGDDSDNSDDDFRHNLALLSKPSGDYNPDTKKIDTSALRHELRSIAPRLHDGKFDSVSSVLYKREIGGCGSGSFNQADRCYMSSQFIPNHMTKIDLHNVKAFCGVFSSSGDLFMSATQDHIIRLYDTSRGAFTLCKSIYARDVGWSVLDTAFSPDQRNLVYCSWSKYIHLCSVDEDNEMHMALPLYPEKNNFCIFSLAYSSDNREILAGACDGNMYIYDLHANCRSMKMDAHDDDISSVVFADDTSQLMYSGGDDAVIKVWDRRTLNEEDPRPVGMLAGHTDGVTCIDSRGDARYLISNSKDQTIKLWDIRMFSCQKAIELSRKAVSGQSWDYRWQPVPKRLLKARKATDGDSSLMTYRGHCVLHTLIRARFSPLASTAQNFIYSGCASGDVVVYNVLTGRILGRLRGHRHCVRDVSWHPYRDIIATSSWDGSLGVWRYRSNEAREDDVCDDSEVDSKVHLRRSSRLRQRSYHPHTS